MTNETQMIDLSEVSTDALKEELDSRGDMPTLDDFYDNEISDEFYNRGLEKSISDFDDEDIEDEYNKRNPSTLNVVDVAERINHRMGLGLDYQADINDLLELVKSL